MQGNYGEAVTELQRVLEIQEKSFGPEHTEVSKTLAAFGEAIRLQGRYDQALDYYRRSLAIMEKRLGTEHPDLAYPLAGIGRTYLGLGEPKKAIDVLERAVVSRKNARADPLEFADTHFALAMALRQSHREPDRAQRLAL